jgi:hypothetical protein
MLRVASLLVLLLVAGDGNVERGGSSAKVALPLVMSVLSKAQVSGSLEYSGRCDPGERLDFPNLKVPGEIANDPLQALQEIFADDPMMQVTQDPNGMIRMVERDVPEDILRVRIKRVSFKSGHADTDVVFDARDALFATLASREVVAFMRQEHIGRPFEFENTSGSRAMPSPKAPHLSGGLDDVTLSQAFDYILRTFPGLWIYESCPSAKGKRAVDFGIYANSSAWQGIGKRVRP